jgi:mono/diheme cytochrome c family protein
MTKIACIASIASALMAVGARAQDIAEIGDADSGRKLAMQDCRACHDVGSSAQRVPGQKGPPSFYAVANMASTTPTSLYVFLHTSHPTMPNFRLDKKESDDVIAYILSLRRQVH